MALGGGLVRLRTERRDAERRAIERALGSLGWGPAHPVVARNFATRLLGMTVTPPLDAAGTPHVLAIPRCSAVHTCAMRYPLDIAFAAASGEVLEVHEGVAPWRFLSCPQAAFTLERASVEVLAGRDVTWDAQQPKAAS